VTSIATTATSASVRAATPAAEAGVGRFEPGRPDDLDYRGRGRVRRLRDRAAQPYLFRPEPVDVATRSRPYQRRSRRHDDVPGHRLVVRLRDGALRVRRRRVLPRLQARSPLKLQFTFTPFASVSPLRPVGVTLRRLALGPTKQRALLALLLLHVNEVVPRERLIDELWGERTRETAATALQGYISGLRKLLEAGNGAERSSCSPKRLATSSGSTPPSSISTASNSSATRANTNSAQATPRPLPRPSPRARALARPPARRVRHRPLCRRPQPPASRTSARHARKPNRRRPRPRSTPRRHRRTRTARPTPPVPRTPARTTKIAVLGRFTAELCADALEPMRRPS
jgi:hypothetical protein